MKVKRTVAMMVILVGLLGIFASKGEAAPAWYFCTVNEIGMAYETLYICLTDTASPPAFTLKWVIANPAYQKQLMAVALTAQSNDQSIHVNIDSAVSYPTLSIMYIMK